MKRFLHFAVFLVGLAAVVWVGRGYVGTHQLALAITTLIGVVYVIGAWELFRFDRTTAQLRRAVTNLSGTPDSLDTWLASVPAALRQSVQLRVQGERVALPGPTLASYLVGLLVLLGMLGTFLGMVATLRGTGAALQSATDLQAIRASLAAPVMGLGFAFGTSVAGVAASAMLGLLAALCRRERQAVAQSVDLAVATTLRGYSLAHQREERVKLLTRQADMLARQADHMPAVIERLDAMMTAMAGQTKSFTEGMLAGQEQFHLRTEAAYARLAATLEQALKAGVADTAQAATGAIQPAVDATMTKLGVEAAALHERVTASVQQHLDGLSHRLEASDRTMTEAWKQALADQRGANETLTQHFGGALDGFAQTFEQRAGRLLTGMTEQLDGVSTRLSQGWTEALAQHKLGHREMAQASTQALTAAAASFDQRARDLVDKVGEAQASLVMKVGEANAALSQNVSEAHVGLTRDLTESNSALRMELAESNAALRKDLSDSNSALLTQLAGVNADLATHLTTTSTTLARDVSETNRALAGQVGESVSALGDQVTQSISGLSGEITGSVSVLTGQVTESVSALTGQVSESMSALTGQVTESYSELSGQVTGSVSALTDQVSESMSALTGQVNESYSELSGQVTGSVSELSVKVTESVSELAGQLTGSVSELTGQLTGSVSELSGQLSGSVSELSGQVTESVSVLTGQVNDSVSGLTQRVEGSMSGLTGQVKESVSALSLDVGGSVSALSDRMVDSMSALSERIAATTTELASGVNASTAELADTVGKSNTDLAQTIARSHTDLRNEFVDGDQARAQAWVASIEALATSLRDEWAQAGQTTAARQQDICDALAATAKTIASDTQTHAQATIAQIEGLVQAAAEAPKVAAEVVVEVRQKLSESMARDNAMLEERSRMLETLGSLLDAVNHASTEQRTAVDALVSTSADMLDRVGTQFTRQIEAETEKLTGIAEKVTGSAVEVSSLSESFGSAVASFSESNDKLLSQLQRIEASLDATATRSDEQLAYYVAQAREVVDLSILSQKQIVENLQRLAGAADAGKAGKGTDKADDQVDQK